MFRISLILTNLFALASGGRHVLRGFPYEAKVLLTSILIRSVSGANKGIGLSAYNSHVASSCSTHVVQCLSNIVSRFMQL